MEFRATPSRSPRVGSPMPINSPRSTEELQSQKQQEVQPDPPDRQPDGCSLGKLLSAFSEQMMNRPPDQVALQLLSWLPAIETAADVHDWLTALNTLNPALCSNHPDLLMRLSERLPLLLAGITPKEGAACVTLCLNTAWGAKQSRQVWLNLCSMLHRLPLPAMEALLTCLHGQRDCEQLPENGGPLIDYVASILDGMTKTLPALGFCAPGNTLVVPVKNTSVALQDGEIMATDTGTERHAIQASGATTDDLPMKIPRELVTLVLKHMLEKLDIDDWMRPEYLALREKDRQVLSNWACVDKTFSTRLAPMVANFPWMQQENSIRSGIIRADEHGVCDRMDNLIRYLVDLKAEAVKSMPCAPGVAQRRLDLLLRNFFIDPIPPGEEDMALIGAYRKLHSRAVLQLASRDQATLSCFAQHVALSTLPLQFLTMAYRMLGLEAPGVTELAISVAYSLPEYPEDVQAQTLISLLSMLPSPSGQGQILARLKDLMDESNSWSTPPHASLSCQWSNLNGMLALLKDPDTALEEATRAADSLLEALRQHHLVGDKPLWTVADIRLLAALCKRSETSAEWKPLGLVGCLADLLRQFCLVSARPDKFAAAEFKAEFPPGILHSASLRLTPREQRLMSDEPWAWDVPILSKALHKMHLPS